MDELRTLLFRQIAAVWRRRWIAIGAAWLVCVLGWIGVHRMPNQYEASARLYVNADAVLTPLLRGLAVDTSPDNQIEMLQRTLLSRPNLETLISKTDLSLNVRTPTDRELLVDSLAKQIEVTPQTQNLFVIKYRNKNPQLAYDVVNTILQIFIESTTGANQSDIQNAQRFLQGQIASYERQLRQAERRRAEFKAKYVDLLPMDNGGTHLEAARDEVATLSGQLQDAQARVKALRQELDATPPLLTEAAAAGMGPGSAALAEAELKLRQMRMQFTDKFPGVIAQEQVVQSLRSAPAQTAQQPSATSDGRALPNPAYEELKLRVVDAETTVASLQRQVGAAQREQHRLEEMARAAPGVEAQYQNLDRDYTVLRKNYEELLARRESTRIAEAADTKADKVKLQIVDPPQVPRVPVAPKRPLLIAGVLVFGLGAGIGFAFLLAQIDTSFSTIDQLRDFGLPVLGGVSAIRRAATRRRILGTLGFGIAILLLVAVCGGLLTHALQTSKPV